eukprot:TRINITY_DN3817_c0_g4_i2.p1 TRINITY_DN3817_c0_g4~~TRINITY_DN3817_c0_g4_i2.p1  ORF type:complete len:294 (+),score=67.56 TRINITY_DN3817_c0_g4_i2:52-933(+)
MEDVNVTLKICTYNIHQFRSTGGSNQPNHIGVAALINELALDVIAFEEACDTPCTYGPESTETRLEYVSRETAMEHVYADACGFLGNALLSKHPIVSSEIHPLRCAQEETRVLLECVLDVGGVALPVYVLHVDNAREPLRIKQLEIALNAIDHSRPHVLMGDFNALKRADYTGARWQEITDRRRRNGWELPATGFIELLESRGYVDCCAERGTDLKTCWAGTRIDYIYCSSDLGAAVKSHRILSDVTLSDHSPVVVELEIPRSSLRPTADLRTVEPSSAATEHSDQSPAEEYY